MRSRNRSLITLGDRIRQKREQQQLSQEMMDEKSGLHGTYISDLAHGKRNASFSALVRVASALGTTVSALVRDVERVRKNPK